MRHCPNCNADTVEARAYCPRCGAKLYKNGDRNGGGGLLVLAAFVFLICCAWFFASSPSLREDGPPAPPRAAADIIPAASAQTPQPARQPAGRTPARVSDPPPARPAATAAPEPAEEDEKEVTVYVTRTGKKYHRGSCQYLRQSKIPMPLSEARRLYDPCSVCDPPE